MTPNVSRGNWMTKTIHEKWYNNLPLKAARFWQLLLTRQHTVFHSSVDNKANTYTHTNSHDVPTVRDLKDLFYRPRKQQDVSTVVSRPPSQTSQSWVKMAGGKTLKCTRKDTHAHRQRDTHGRARTHTHSTPVVLGAD